MKARAEALLESESVPGPILKWPGGKRQLLPELEKHVPAKFGGYFEPFAGGLALFFHLVNQGRLLKGACLSDVNDELIVTYATVQAACAEVIKRLRLHAAAYAHEGGGKKYYYAVRATMPKPGAAVAARMIFLNRTCFNGVYRVNKKGGFNVPHGSYKNPTICNEEGLRAASRAFESAAAEMRVVDFSAAVGPARKGDFVYFDPPYVPASASADFTSYTKGGFDLQDHARLAECALGLKKRGVHVLLSNSDTEVTREIYAKAGGKNGFSMRTVQARRNINSKASNRGPVGELLIW